MSLAGPQFGDDLQGRRAAEHYTIQVLCNAVTATVCRTHRNHAVSAAEPARGKRSWHGAA